MLETEIRHAAHVALLKVAVALARNLPADGSFPTEQDALEQLVAQAVAGKEVVEVIVTDATRRVPYGVAQAAISLSDATRLHLSIRDDEDDPDSAISFVLTASGSVTETKRHRQL